MRPATKLGFIGFVIVEIALAIVALPYVLPTANTEAHKIASRVIATPTPVDGRPVPDWHKLYSEMPCSQFVNRVDCEWHNRNAR